MPSERQKQQRQQRKIKRETAEVRRDSTPQLWRGYNENNLGQVVDAAGVESVGFVSGNESLSTGDPVCFVNQPGQPGAIVTKAVPNIFEWNPPAPNPLGGLLSLLWESVYTRVGIRRYIVVEQEEQVAQGDDYTLIWADSEKEWYGLHASRNNYLAWLEGKTLTYLRGQDVEDVLERVFQRGGLLANHYLQIFTGFSPASDGPVVDLSHHFFNLRTGQLSKHQLEGSYTPPVRIGEENGGSALTITGEVKIFEDLALDASLSARYDYEETEEEVTGPWPVPGREYTYVYYRHRRAGSPRLSGIGWAIDSDPCAVDSFIPLRVININVGGFNVTVPKPVEHSATEDGPLFMVANSGTRGQLRSGPSASETIPGSFLIRMSAPELRRGNLFTFEVVDDYDAIEILFLTAEYPATPNLGGTFYFGNDPENMGGFTLTYSDVDPCKDPRPYTRTRKKRRHSMTGNRYLPIARNNLKLLYYEAKNISFSSEQSQVPDFSPGGSFSVDGEDETITSWAADYRCVFEDLETETKKDVFSQQPIALPFYNIDNSEIGKPYTFRYSQLVEGWNYKKYCAAPSNGTRVTGQTDFDDRSGVSQEWKDWFSDIVARGDIPVFGKTYGLSKEAGEKTTVKIFKGRITSISYDDSITELSQLDGVDDSARLNNWPVEFTSFTIVFDEFLAEAESGFSRLYGVDFMRPIDIKADTEGAGTPPSMGGLAVIDTGSILNATGTEFGISDSAYDLANLFSIAGLSSTLGRADFGLDLRNLYTATGRTFGASRLRLEWRTRKDGTEEVLTHYRYTDQDAAAYFMSFQLDGLIFPERPDPKLYTLHPIFKLIELPSGKFGLFFDRLEFVPNDIKPEDDTPILSDTTVIPFD